MNDEIRELETKLIRFFADRPSVRLAFLFGSTAVGRTSSESDVDIGVCLDDGREETPLWRELSRYLEAEVDLVRLDQAPASLVSAILKQGTPLVVRDRGLYLHLLLDQTMEAEDFASFAGQFRQVARRSTSLSPEDRVRLLERVQFLEDELCEIKHFRQITAEEYRTDKTKRRNLERWTENIINATIDVAKLVLASEHRPMPRTYQQAMEMLASLAGVDEEGAVRFSSFARLRNLLAHEYLEILHDRISDFIRDFPPIYGKVALFIQSLLENQETPESGK
ncbi:MAG: type VII toxin-antitoxin system HepT family RNase toxin [Planctomycetota bacterium]